MVAAPASKATVESDALILSPALSHGKRLPNGGRVVRLVTVGDCDVSVEVQRKSNQILLDNPSCLCFGVKSE